ncbi:MAG: hypothetical protein ACREHD_31790, partial [Pirellulales bacterium]
MLAIDGWIGGATGNWNVAANWDNGIPTSTSDVSITGSVTVTSSSSTGIDGLTVGAGANLIIDNSGIQVANTGGVTDNGTIDIGDSSTYGALQFSGTQTLSGSGSVVFGSGEDNVLDLTTDSSTLTVGPNIIIRGAQGGVGTNVHGT